MSVLIWITIWLFVAADKFMPQVGLDQEYNIAVASNLHNCEVLIQMLVTFKIRKPAVADFPESQGNSRDSCGFGFPRKILINRRFYVIVSQVKIYGM